MSKRSLKSWLYHLNKRDVIMQNNPLLENNPLRFVVKIIDCVDCDGVSHITVQHVDGHYQELFFFEYSVQDMCFGGGDWFEFIRQDNGLWVTEYIVNSKEFDRFHSDIRKNKTLTSDAYAELKEKSRCHSVSFIDDLGSQLYYA